MMSILRVVQSQSHSILSINYRLQIIELIITTEFELKRGFVIANAVLVSDTLDSFVHRILSVLHRSCLLSNVCRRSPHRLVPVDTKLFLLGRTNAHQAVRKSLIRVELCF